MKQKIPTQIFISHQKVKIKISRHLRFSHCAFLCCSLVSSSFFFTSQDKKFMCPPSLLSLQIIRVYICRTFLFLKGNCCSPFTHSFIQLFEILCINHPHLCKINLNIARKNDSTHYLVLIDFIEFCK